MPAEQLDAVSAIKKYGKEIDLVICSWPYMNDNCYNALLCMRKVNPDTAMLYIGEGSGGATASNKFCHAAVFVDDLSFSQAVRNYRPVFTIHDSLYLVK